MGSRGWGIGVSLSTGANMACRSLFKGTHLVAPTCPLATLAPSCWGTPPLVGQGTGGGREHQGETGSTQELGPAVTWPLLLSGLLRLPGDPLMTLGSGDSDQTILTFGSQCFCTMPGTQENILTLHKGTKERGLRRNQLCQHLNFELPVSRAVRKYISAA